MPAENINIRPADDRILRALHRYCYLTTLQLCRALGYSPASIAYLQKILRRLTEADYCQRIFLPRPSPHGCAPSVYSLAWRGVRWLEQHGIERLHRLRPKEQREHSYLFLAHSLATADFLISGELLTRQVPEIILQNMLNERDLKRSPIYVRDGDGNRIAVIFDGWLDFRINDSIQMAVCAGVDRGSEGQAYFRGKVKALLASNDGPYQERFDTSSLTIAVVATPGTKRMRDLLHWTETELGNRHNPAADLFRFTDASPANTDPETFFLGPLWYRPFDDEAMPLLESAL